MNRPQLEVQFAHNGDRLLRMIRQQHPEYHPILAIARIAHQAEAGLASVDEDGKELAPRPNLELALRAHSTVLRYVEPELKSVEVSMRDPDRRRINVSLFDDDLPVQDVVEVEEEPLDGPPPLTGSQLPLVVDLAVEEVERDAEPA